MKYEKETKTMANREIMGIPRRFNSAGPEQRRLELCLVEAMKKLTGKQKRWRRRDEFVRERWRKRLQFRILRNESENCLVAKYFFF